LGQKNNTHSVLSGRSSPTKIKQIIQIVPHSGGLESKDFCNIILKSLEKYLNISNIKYTIVENTEYSIKIEVMAKKNFLDFAEGLVKLVRVSPFGKGDKIHTSFCKLNVTVVKEKDIIVINDNDLKWDFFKSTGPGGQHKNKTMTAVRLTHTPSGCVVISSNERSQLDNKRNALIQMQTALESRSEEKSMKHQQKEWKKNISPSDANISIYMNYQLVNCKSTGMETKKLKDFLSGNWNLVS
jgi:peptide chain release factor 2